MIWHVQFSSYLGDKWCVTEADGELSEVMREAEQRAITTLGGEPKLARMVASRLTEP